MEEVQCLQICSCLEVASVMTVICAVFAQKATQLTSNMKQSSDLVHCFTIMEAACSTCSYPAAVSSRSLLLTLHFPASSSIHSIVPTTSSSRSHSHSHSHIFRSLATFLSVEIQNSTLPRHSCTSRAVRLWERWATSAMGSLQIVLQHSIP